eukprot:6211329-Pleurochrysis_carterae.AAC.1
MLRITAQHKTAQWFLVGLKLVKRAKFVVVQRAGQLTRQKLASEPPSTSVSAYMPTPSLRGRVHQGGCTNGGWPWRRHCW